MLIRLLCGFLGSLGIRVVDSGLNFWKSSTSATNFEGFWRFGRKFQNFQCPFEAIGNQEIEDFMRLSFKKASKFKVGPRAIFWRIFQRSSRISNRWSLKFWGFWSILENRLFYTPEGFYSSPKRLKFYTLATIWFLYILRPRLGWSFFNGHGPKTFKPWSDCEGKIFQAFDQPIRHPLLETLVLLAV